MTPEIAMSLSGGGYRAAMFHLGTFVYLHHLRNDEGKSFLDMVNTISTISGGTITGLWYMLQYVNDRVSEDSFKELYYKLKDSVVIEKGLNNLFDNSRNSFIKEMVSIYDEVFFNNACFDEVLDIVDKGHIHHFSANGTDFSNGYAFRFQASRKIVNANPKFNRGIIGNNEHRIPWELAKKIKLSEILAVSSCFPGGFEPIFFPSDFQLIKDENIQSSLEMFKEDIPLMDGGIVDNQGVEPILLANAQMQFDDQRAKVSKDFPCHDLIIVSDVSHPNINSITKCEGGDCTMVSLWSIDKILNILIGLCLIFFVLFITSDSEWLSGFCSCLTVILLVIRIGSMSLKRFVIGKLSDEPIAIDINKLWKYPISNILVLLRNRGSSFLQLSKSIFMKPIRQMRYKAIYNNDMWLNRRITNTIYELTKEYGSWKSKRQNSRIPEWLVPSADIQEVSKKATEMGTTLWFTVKDKEEGVPEALLACGQYNICMNLLEYIEKLKSNSDNTTEAHNVIKGFERQLRKDWEEFKVNPMWLVENFR